MACDHTALCPSRLSTCSLQSTQGCPSSLDRIPGHANRRQLGHSGPVDSPDSSKHGRRGIHVARLHLASPRANARQMGLARERPAVGIPCPCLHEVALHRDVAQHVAHTVARTEAKKHNRISDRSCRWQRCPLLAAVVEWRVGNRWITPPNHSLVPWKGTRIYDRGGFRRRGNARLRAISEFIE